jgi:hypothetical protein
MSSMMPCFLLLVLSSPIINLNHFLYCLTSLGIFGCPHPFHTHIVNHFCDGLYSLDKRFDMTKGKVCNSRSTVHVIQASNSYQLQKVT